MGSDLRGFLEIENRIGPPALIVGGVWRLFAFYMADEGDADGVRRQRDIAVRQWTDGDGCRRLLFPDCNDLDAFIFILSHFQIDLRGEGDVLQRQVVDHDFRHGIRDGDAEGRLREGLFRLGDDGFFVQLAAVFGEPILQKSFAVSEFPYVLLTRVRVNENRSL